MKGMSAPFVGVDIYLKSGMVSHQPQSLLKKSTMRKITYWRTQTSEPYTQVFWTFELTYYPHFGAYSDLHAYFEIL